MRLALLTNFIPPYRVPVYEELQRICGNLRVFISATSESGRAWEPSWGSLQVRVQRNLTVRGRWSHPHGFSEGLSIQIPYDTLPQLIRFRPDVVVSGELGARTLQAALYRRIFPNSRLIVWTTLSEVTEHGRGELRYRLRKTLLRSAEAVLVNGLSGARYVQKLGVSRNRMFFAPYTTDLRPFMAVQSSRATLARRRLLYVGSLSERKGIVPFLNVLARWTTLHPEQEIELRIAGDGPLASQVKSCSDFPRNLTVMSLGSIAYDRLPEVYRTCGILAFPTLADEWGLVVTEAMASGVPVLGSLYSQAVEELVTEGVNGWTFRPDRPQDMYAALDRALTTSHDELNEMAQRARLSVQNITPAAVAESIMSAVEFVGCPA